MDRGKYNIKAVAALVGLNPTTIRAWERRYQVLDPDRSESGHRIYSDSDVAKLRWIVDKQKEGLSVSKAIQLYEMPVNRTEVPTDYGIELRDQLFEALTNFEERHAHDIMNKAFSMFSFDKVIQDIVGPLLHEIGMKWEKGAITIAHEHFATAFLRARLSTLSLQMPINPFLPRILCVCAPEEEHELGLLFFTLYLRQSGFDVIFLGAGIPVQDLVTVTKQLTPRAVVLSCTISDHLKDLDEAIAQIQLEVPQTEIGLGGYAVDQHPEKYGDLLLGSHDAAWKSWLSRLTPTTGV
ncbi:MerR family transcriptional regulator [Exiguobacterium undae]|uniref:MerR family transcriptional regulator n=1 Tax=Exiguobacterium undae TaxID=169177 RepID=A0ABX2VA91_9BACL|nr:B12-binding domain-containing protein [Exiguobacterium undae]OAN15140.1 MerR family transcriptional regulator [Exiguobacterium undae]